MHVQEGLMLGRIHVCEANAVQGGGTAEKLVRQAYCRQLEGGCTVISGVHRANIPQQIADLYLQAHCSQRHQVLTAL